MHERILSFPFCLVLSQSSSEDQLEHIGGDISAGVGWQIALVLHGSLCIHGLDADSMLDVLSGPEGVGAGRLVGAEANRVAMMVVMIVVEHVDAAVEGVEHPMSRFLYFLLLFCPDILSLTGVKGLEVLSSWLFLFSICYFLMERGKGPHPSAPGVVSIHLACLVSPVGMYTIHHLDGHLHVNLVFWDGTVEVMEAKFTFGLEVEVHSGKVSILSYTVS